ncbi:uncharacterized protein LOC111071139 [Drosophila obscura]|uniref:uncharacterized protein LOC111071139 n=1 Tax=Drosophila obscura TaxID=7282 RepID=UPI001BB1F236|nr:uncharacterized protein LOC111071139 [Drosophila obscura]
MQDRVDTSRGKTEGIQIGTQEGTSTLYVRTLNEYVAIMSSDYDSSAIKDVNGEIIHSMSVNYVPVSCRWQGCSWLMAYILSFTTTGWWNHSVLIETTLINTGGTRAASDMELKAKFMPRAATVYIPGGYEYICLVIVDDCIKSFDCDYTICSGISAKREGEHNFAAMVHAYLGRAESEKVCKITVGDVNMALQNATQYLANEEELNKTLLKCAVLATSKYNGYGISSGPKNLTKQEGTIERDLIYAPYSFNSKDALKMGEHELLDLVSLSTEALTEILENHKHWRTDPLGYFAFGSVGITTDDSHRPIPEKNITYVSQYKLSTLSPSVRIMMACGVYDRGPAGRLTNWAAAELGETIFMHNGMGCRHRLWSVCSSNNVWATITGNFVATGATRGRVVDRLNHHQILGLSMNIASKAADIPVSWYDTHYSWNCPW